VNHTKGISGVHIDPGTIGQISITPQEPMNFNLVRYYTIKFNHHAELPDESKIEVKFPSEFDSLIA
jgi:hypothetical protein